VRWRQKEKYHETAISWDDSPQIPQVAGRWWPGGRDQDDRDLKPATENSSETLS
jgi:hypothetical protein